MLLADLLEMPINVSVHLSFLLGIQKIDALKEETAELKVVVLMQFVQK